MMGGTRVGQSTDAHGIWPYLAIAALSLWLRAGFPLHAIADAQFDDSLFFKLSNHLALGEWLGPFDNATLVKGPFYPVFIALTASLALPLKLAEQLVWLGVSFYAARYVIRHTGSHRLALILFTALALNPVFWHNQLARIIREGIYVSLCPLLLIGFCALAATPGSARPWSEYGRIRTMVSGTLLGATAVAFWTTREEGIWLALPLASVVAVWIWWQWPSLAPATASVRARSLVTTGYAAAIATTVAVFALGIFGLKLQNWRSYGIFATTEFAYAPFIDAYGALARIQHDTWRPLVVFPKDARERAYAVSPSAKELASTLEGRGGGFWTRVGCEINGRTRCDEILASHFMWALRDAVTNAGHYESGAKATAFYDRLAREVNAACDSGKITCLATRHTLMPPFQWEYVGSALSAVPRIALIMLSLRQGPVGTEPSEGPRPLLQAIAQSIGPIHPALDSQRFAFRATASSPLAPPQIGFLERPGGEFDAIKATLPATDLELRSPDLRFSRFVIETGCELRMCAVVVLAGNRNLVVPLEEIAQGRTFGGPELGLRIEEVGPRASPAATATERLRGIQVAIAEAISRTFSIVIPMLFLTGFAGLVRHLFKYRLGPEDPAPAMTLLVLASLIAVAMRIALLSYLNAVAIPSVNLLYSSPATPFVLIVAILGTWLWLPARHA